MSGGRIFQPTEPARRRAARANLLALLGFLGLAALVPLARDTLLDGKAAWPSSLLSRMLLAEAMLCPLTGLAAWLVWRRIDVGLERKRAALRRWGWVLMLSALWPVALNAMQRPALAMGLLALCFATATWTVVSFRRLQPTAAFLLLPYAAWSGAMTVIVIAHF